MNDDKMRTLIRVALTSVLLGFCLLLLALFGWGIWAILTEISK